MPEASALEGSSYFEWTYQKGQRKLGDVAEARKDWMELCQVDESPAELQRRKREQ